MENNVNKSGGFAKKLLSREVLMYLLFGVLTTLVGWAVYFAIMIFGRLAFSIPNDDTSSAGYIALYTVAQVVQWVCAVLFAFFTNKKWVFTEADKSKNTLVQLLAFSGGRLLTFALDYFITFFGGLLLSNLIPSLNNVELLGFSLNINEFSAKLVAAIIVIIGNYIFSKLLVFKKK